MEVCKKKNNSEVTFHRWKRQFGQRNANEAKRLKELEREGTELTKTLAEALLAKRVLEYVVEKIVSLRHKEQMVTAVLGDGLCLARAGCRIFRLARATWWYQAGVRSDATG